MLSFDYELGLSAILCRWSGNMLAPILHFSTVRAEIISLCGCAKSSTLRVHRPNLAMHENARQPRRSRAYVVFARLETQRLKTN